MRFEILDVEHGFCAYAIGHDRSQGALLFDCGSSSENRPSEVLPQQGISSIHGLFVTNYDEDHISDIVEVRSSFPIGKLWRNPLTADQIRSLKTPPISPSMKELLDMVECYRGGVATPDRTPSGTSASVFYNSLNDFQDTNNLSLLTFLGIGHMTFAVAGDLAKPGWTKLLKNPEVQSELGRVDVFVASHHGREDGYCPEVFEYCAPKLIAVSDGPIEHSTQEMVNVYARHASGTWWNGSQRKVITTRRDGNLRWDL